MIIELSDTLGACVLAVEGPGVVRVGGGDRTVDDGHWLVLSNVEPLSVDAAEAIAVAVGNAVRTAMFDALAKTKEGT